MRRLVILLSLAGCAPSPDVVTAGAGHEFWNTDATRAPPEADGDVTSVDPGGQGGDGGEGGGGGMDHPPDADTMPPSTSDASIGPDPDAGRPRADGPGAAMDAPPANGPPQTCTLSFQVTTVTFGGSYAPRNVGAIWVSDKNNRFVKSLTVWGSKRRSHLVTWEQASQGSTVDAITSATAGSHGTRMGKWNCTGLDEKPVADGNYRINVEFTERNSEGRVMTPLDFVKSPAPASAMPPDQTNFKGIRLQVTSP